MEEYSTGLFFGLNDFNQKPFGGNQDRAYDPRKNAGLINPILEGGEYWDRYGFAIFHGNDCFRASIVLCNMSTSMRNQIDMKRTQEDQAKILQEINIILQECISSNLEVICSTMYDGSLEVQPKMLER